MAKMISLKRPKKTAAQLKKERSSMEVSPGCDRNQYPYGTELRFEEEVIEKIPALQSIKADETVKIVATGFVKEIRIVDKSKKTGQRNRQNVEIQLQNIAVSVAPKKKPEDMTSAEYADFRKNS